MPSPDDIGARVEAVLGTLPGRKRPVEIAFYGGTFLGLPLDAVDGLLSTASSFLASGRVQGIRFSTRPDTITRQILEAIRPYPVTTIELGVQSLDDGVLEQSCRGHTAEDTRNAIARLERLPVAVGLQLMIGLPGDSDRNAIETAREAVRLKPDFVRIYPTLVFADTPLADQYRDGEYRPLSIDEAVGRAKSMFVVFLAAGIPVIRMGLQETSALATPETVVAGPHHPAFGEWVLSACFLDLAEKTLRRHPPTGDRLIIRVNPRSESQFRGSRNKNILALHRAFPHRPLHVVPDPRIDTGAIAVDALDAVYLSTLGAAP